MRKIFVVKSPHSKQSWLIQASNPHPWKWSPPHPPTPTAQEHLGMFSANVITASVSGQHFKEPLLLLSHFNTWWCHGPLWGRRNSSNQLPLMTFSFKVFFLSPPFAQFFLPLFLSLVHNRGSLYGLIKQPPSHWLALLLEPLYEKCMPLFKCIDSPHRHPPIFCPHGLLKSKKFQNMEKKDPAQGFVLTIPPLNIFDYRHIAVWETRAMLVGEFPSFYGHSQWQKGMQSGKQMLWQTACL